MGLMAVFGRKTMSPALSDSRKLFSDWSSDISFSVAHCRCDFLNHSCLGRVPSAAATRLRRNSVQLMLMLLFELPSESINGHKDTKGRPFVRASCQEVTPQTTTSARLSRITGKRSRHVRGFFSITFQRLSKIVTVIHVEPWQFVVRITIANRREIKVPRRSVSVPLSHILAYLLDRDGKSAAIDKTRYYFLI